MDDLGNHAEQRESFEAVGLGRLAGAVDGDNAVLVFDALIKGRVRVGGRGTGFAVWRRQFVGDNREFLGV